MIDQEYENFSYSGDRWFSFQSKLSAYRKEIEAQSQEEMNTKVCFLQSYGIKSAPVSFLACYVSSPMRLLFLQMQHFKDVEIAKVRMEEKAKFHKEFDKLKQELERTHEMKAKALMDREKNAIDRLQKQQEVNECKCTKIISFSF